MPALPLDHGAFGGVFSVLSAQSRPPLSTFKITRFVIYPLLQAQQERITMANQLEMAKIDAILALHQCHWPAECIVKELALHRDTVRLLLQANPNQNVGCARMNRCAAEPAGFSQELPNDPSASSGELESGSSRRLGR
jgi:hypothetical protein